jgi:hypothetical protein
MRLKLIKRQEPWTKGSFFLLPLALGFSLLASALLLGLQGKPGFRRHRPAAPGRFRQPLGPSGYLGQGGAHLPDGSGHRRDLPFADLEHRRRGTVRLGRGRSDLAGLGLSGPPRVSAPAGHGSFGRPPRGVLGVCAGAAQEYGSGPTRSSSP